MTRTFPSLLCGAILCVCIPFALTGCGTSSAMRGGELPKPEAARRGPVSSRVITPDTATREADAEAGVEAAPAAPSAPAPGKTAPAAPPPAPSSGPSPEKPSAAGRVSARMRNAPPLPAAGEAAEGWQPLLRRLQNDPGVSPEVARFFVNLPGYSPAPMGAKIKELFTSAFLRVKRPDDGKARQPAPRIYRNIVTAENLRKCADFLTRNKITFDAVEKRHPVPREILVSLLFVETRLGTFVGTENAFWSLACMAAADSPERMAGGLGDIPITAGHDAWLKAKLADKSEWAYKELRALLAFCVSQRLDPHVMPGSVYGAIGICQFMPSNLTSYGEDGDGDGVINLFTEPDAIFSAALYLTKHGWSAGQSVDRQRAVLKRYNNLTIYANTILALAESIRTGTLQTGPPDGKQGSGKKNPKKK